MAVAQLKGILLSTSIWSRRNAADDNPTTSQTHGDNPCGQKAKVKLKIMGKQAPLNLKKRGKLFHQMASKEYMYLNQSKCKIELRTIEHLTDLLHTHFMLTD